jgi:hypothetical protein
MRIYRLIIVVYVEDRVYKLQIKNKNVLKHKSVQQLILQLENSLHFNQLMIFSGKSPTF